MSIQAVTQLLKSTYPSAVLVAALATWSTQGFGTQAGAGLTTGAEGTPTTSHAGHAGGAGELGTAVDAWSSARDSCSAPQGLERFLERRPAACPEGESGVNGLS